jgi:hypothetical protein
MWQDLVVVALSKTWHADCFKCTYCRNKLVKDSWTSRDVRVVMLSVSASLAEKAVCSPGGDLHLFGRMIRTASGAWSVSTTFEHSSPTPCHNTTDNSR